EFGGNPSHVARWPIPTTSAAAHPRTRLRATHAQDRRRFCRRGEVNDRRHPWRFKLRPPPAPFFCVACGAACEQQERSPRHTKDSCRTPAHGTTAFPPAPEVIRRGGNARSTEAGSRSFLSLR